MKAQMHAKELKNGRKKVSSRKRQPIVAQLNIGTLDDYTNRMKVIRKKRAREFS
jgi:hypothetical protein